tara:strand:+ start:1463 stop:2248 length:786 start_codon:yes stop_codon:yes gene_type:complete
MKQQKDVIAGLGEIGQPLYKILSKSTIVVGYDKKVELMDKKKFSKYCSYNTEILHICLPYNKFFQKTVLKLEKEFLPEIIVIHSTVEPHTTRKLQNKTNTPIVYSPVRGVHSRKNDDLQPHKKGILYDIKRYVKFYSVYPEIKGSSQAGNRYSRRLTKCGLKTKKISIPITLELAKILCDTSYYGWLITYAQLTNTIAMQNNVDYDEMWTFAEEIHKFLGNRPKMYPGIIGGHCIIPNLELINNDVLNLIKKINQKYKLKI